MSSSSCDKTTTNIDETNDNIIRESEASEITLNRLSNSSDTAIYESERGNNFSASNPLFKISSRHNSVSSVGSGALEAEFGSKPVQRQSISSNIKQHSEFIAENPLMKGNVNRRSSAVSFQHPGPPPVPPPPPSSEVNEETNEDVASPLHTPNPSLVLISNSNHSLSMTDLYSRESDFEVIIDSCMIYYTSYDHFRRHLPL